MPITRVHDPFFTGNDGIPVKIKRGNWEMIQDIMRATKGIPHAEVNPLTSGIVSKETAWKAMDKLISMWRRVYPGEAEKWWSKEAARAKLSGHGGTKDKSMRLLVSAPKGLAVLIRGVFPGQSQGGSHGKKFWRMFAERYPELRATERV